tara:strand:- start:377 stop:604 length:228 start_codon:yes stop_codon:yes gene_type:complete
MDKHYTIEVVCLFCDSVLKVEEGKEYTSGDMIKCHECGEMNDFDSVLDIAKEKGVEMVKNEATKEIKAKLKNLFK